MSNRKLENEVFLFQKIKHGNGESFTSVTLFFILANVCLAFFSSFSRKASSVNVQGWNKIFWTAAHTFCCLSHLHLWSFGRFRLIKPSLFFSSKNDICVWRKSLFLTLRSFIFVFFWLGCVGMRRSLISKCQRLRQTSFQLKLVFPVYNVI